MKKILLIGLVALVGFTVQAQVAPKSYKFIPSNISVLVVSNTIAITNLSSVASLYTTNKYGTVWTNSSGVGVVAGNNNTTALLQDAPLWVLRDGSGAWAQNTNTTIGYIQSYATLAVTGTSQSGANAAVTLVFAPVYGGKESTTTSDHWTIAFTPTASSTQTFTTNAPLYLWPGAEKLRLRRIVNADTDASSAWNISDISLNGFVPTGGY